MRFISYADILRQYTRLRAFVLAAAAALIHRLTELLQQPLILMDKFI